MASNRIFQLIRKEEVVLFAGAGMSIYAGYPSGGDLAKILHEGLPEDLKEEIDFDWNLPKLCDDIYQLSGNKSYLIETLKKEFKKKPVSTATHKLLAGIPHFRTIITTNYDTLIESENDNIEVVRTSVDLASTKPSDQLLFKIHSDFTDIANIILTSSDYLNYFTKDSEKTIFWNAIRAKLASNHILFVGYSLDDQNVKDIIIKIINELGDFRKEMYFVAPSLSKVKLAFLQRHNIKHIKSTGEELIKQIDQDIRDNYLPDLSKGIGSADTAFNFATSKNLNIELKKSERGIDIGSVKSLDSNTGYNWDLKVQLSGEEKDKFAAFIENRSFDEITINSETLKEFSFSVKDVRIRNQDNISKIILQKKPNFDFNINIIFEDDFEVDNCPFVFSVIKPNAHENHLKIILDGFTIMIKLIFDPINDKNRFYMDLIPPEIIKSTNVALQFYEILSRITSNKKFKIYREGKLFFNSDQFTLPFQPEAFNADSFKEYFIDLKKIEKHFNVKFTDINIHESFYERAKLIVLKINREFIVHEFETLDVTCHYQEEMELIKNSEKAETALVMSDKEKTILNLHGIDFDLGYQFQVIKDTIILNPESLEHYKTTQIKIGSKTNLIRTMFSDDKIIDTHRIN